MWRKADESKLGSIILCPINVSDETDMITFSNELSSIDWHIPKRIILVIGRDMNFQIGKDENKFYLQIPVKQVWRKSSRFFTHERDSIEK